MKSNSGKDNITLQRVNIFENEKIVLLTVPKVAHSWCNTKFLQKDNQLVADSEFAINRLTFELTGNLKKQKIRTDDYFVQIQKTWQTILDKKEKRDLVIFYRNPYEHFLSAFMQDYSKSFFPLEDNTQVYWEYFIESLQVPSIIKHQFLNDLRQQKNFDADIITKYSEIASQIININFDFYLKRGSFEQGHYTLWLSFINRLLSSNKFDINKIRFVDIYDAPLELQLKNVINIDKGNSIDTDQNINRGYSTHSWSFNILDNLIKNDIRYYDIISSFLKYEMLYYEDIKNTYKKQHLYNPQS